jgi:hypothetical protein
MASTISLIVAPSDLSVCLTSANANVALTNLRSAASMWLMKVGAA